GSLLALASRLGFWLGVPLLAALCFGEEFQHRTLPLLLSQPVERGQIWTEKWLVSTASILSAAVVYLLAWRGTVAGNFGLMAGWWVILSLCTGPFWTLI